MKLEDQFFQSFFYPFIIGVILSAAIVITSSVIFTNNYIDLNTSSNLVNLERKHAKINLNSINLIISTYLLKAQASLNELINYYQNLAGAIKSNNTYITDVSYIDELFFKSGVDIFNNYYSFIEENEPNLDKMCYWFTNADVNLSKVDYGSDLRKQLKALSEMLPNMYSTFSTNNATTTNFYFFFEKTDLLLFYPVDYYHKHNKINETLNFLNVASCTDEKGDIYTTYKFQCRNIYANIKKAQTDIFDYNYDSNINRSIFITEFYLQSGDNGENVFTICIIFQDPITAKDAYACADISQKDLLFNLDDVNNKINGYYFVVSVGFNKVLFFPLKNEIAKTPGENIFDYDTPFYLNEKTYFINHIQKIMTSNYIEHVTDISFDEIYSNGNNSEDQYFSLNGARYNFSIYPLIVENIKGNKEHVLNIIYVYNNTFFYNQLNTDMDIGVQVFLEGIIFLVFGSGLLYLIVLSINILSKYIVIPIKNVNYMLKGINIGGESRLEYLDFLKKKQDENIELLEKMLLIEEKNKKKENGEDAENNNANNDINIKEEKDGELINNDDGIEGNEQNEQNEVEENDELINAKVDYNQKFDEESEFIEKEATFYDFDEQLLQFRPLEIDRLVKALIDLKGALTLTSSDQPVEQIIDYSSSEDIFMNFKNKEGATICESNIGNLQSQLMKYDNAIYHLAVSLEDNKLKRYLSRSLSDEYDESDTLLNKIAMSFSKTKAKEKMNVLIMKQLNNSKENFSQKIIGVLINSRYTRLIHVYLKFFSLIQKSNSDVLNGQFMNTTYHKINYYHKTLIQYIFLSFVKNDLVKIGESILDYIEFLLKFKLKTSNDNKYILNIQNKERQELKQKQNYKRYIFDKIVNWINLFDDYISHVRDNTSLGDDKSIMEDFNHAMNSTNSEFDSGSQSVFLFRVNVQRGEYLKGKFALRCKNINDALFYFIRAAKKKSIVSDGLIKKKALKRIGKILIKLYKKYEKYGIIRWQMKSKFSEYEKSKIRSFNKKHTAAFNKEEEDKTKNKKHQLSFRQEMEKIKNSVCLELNESEAKQAKDIIIIIDLNKYNTNENRVINTDKIDSFIDQTKTILENYLSSSDRLGVFIYTTQYQIICPLLGKNEIDLNNFSKDLIYYKKNIFDEKEESEDSDEEELQENDLEKEKIGLNNEGSNFSDSGSNNSMKNKEGKQFRINDVVKGLIESVNYSKNYLKMKEIDKNEKYVILFTDLFNNYKISDEKIHNNFNKLEEEKSIIFLLVGKNKSKEQKDKNLIDEESYEKKSMAKIINDKYGDKSEVIDFENMKKIKTILSSNNVIKDEIIYPNEIYK